MQINAYLRIINVNLLEHRVQFILCRNLSWFTYNFFIDNFLQHVLFQIWNLCLEYRCFWICWEKSSWMMRLSIIAITLRMKIVLIVNLFLCSQGISLIAEWSISQSCRLFFAYIKWKVWSILISISSACLKWTCYLG